MKINKGIFALILLVCICGLSSCRRGGCTDVNSCNYDPKASLNDGTCIDKGKVTFWQSTASNGYEIVVTVNSTEAHITTSKTETPLCDATGCANFSLCPGPHSYTAHEVFPGLATWSGTVTASEDGCLTVLLN